MSPLSGAEWAIQQGFSVFPLLPRDKKPLVKDWTHVASCDPSQLVAWSTEHPGCNFGIRTGSGLVVIDVDGSEGLASLEELERSGLVLPPTLLVHTGRGAHRYYRTEAEIRNSASLLAPNIDVRSAGGYVVAPGSIHPNGAVYTLESRPEFVCDIAPLPGWVIQRTAQKPQGKLGAVRGRIAKGKRNSELAKLAGAMRKRGCSKGSIEAMLMARNREACDPPLEDSEVEAIAESIARYPSGEAVAEVVCLESIAPREIKWLSPNWLARGTISILSGDPGAGKTWLALSMAADLSNGITPLTGCPCEPGMTLYLSRENPLAEVVVPRLIAHGANRKKIRYLNDVWYGGDDHPVTLADVDAIEAVVVNENIRLVIFDPLQSYMGSDVDAHRANETRPLMDRLAKMAERTGCCVLILRHLTKATGGKALHRGQGSADLTGAARTELFVEGHPAEKERRVLALAKSNLGRIPDSLLWSIENNRVVWHGSCSLRADDLAGPPGGESERTALEEAQTFLISALREGPLSSTEVIVRAAEEGIAEKTLRRAKRFCGVASKKTGSGKATWVWSLPAQDGQGGQVFL